VEDEETKYGLAVSGIIDPHRFASNKGLRVGDRLLLTKPIGTGVLATGIKAGWDGAEGFEDLLYTWAGMLNKAGGEVIRELGLVGATDVTGFGLGGHLLEMARASGVRVTLSLEAIPFIPEAVELAGMGMIPAGSFANRKFCSSLVQVGEGCDPLLVDLVFDAQTSGGLILSVPEDKVDRAVNMLQAGGALAASIGRVTSRAEHGCRLEITP
jgi:selenide,water dikinase